MKKKQEKLKEQPINNEQMFVDLMNHKTWDESVEEQNTQQQQAPMYEPTGFDLLSDWIIGKDQQRQNYAFGGKKFQGDKNSWLNTEHSSWYVPGTVNPDQGAWEGTNAIASGVTVLNGVLGGLADIQNGYMRVNADDQIAERNRLLGQNAGFGTTTQRFNDMSNLQFANTGLTSQDVGGMSTGEGLLGIGTGLTSGAALGAQVGGVPGAIIGGALGAIKSGIKWGVNNFYANKTASEQNNLNTILNNQIIAKTNYNNTIQDQLDMLRQRQVKNGGKIHVKSDGGYINSASDNYKRQLTEFNTGGNHEDNPNGGVQQGVDPSDGQPNLVEEGETKWNDYIFSKRVFATGGTLKVNKLNDKKYDGKSYAEISKDLYKEYKERPNDAIARRTWEALAARLQQAQEADKLKLKQKKVEGFISSLDDDQLNALMNTMQEEYSAQEQQQQLSKQQEAEQVAMQDEAYNEQLNEEAAMNGINGMYAYGGHKAQYGLEFGRQFDYNDFNSLNYPLLRFHPIAEPVLDKSEFDYNVSLTPDYIPKRSFKIPDINNKTQNTNINNNNNNNSIPLLRFAPILGSGLNYLKDVIGSQNQNDYSDANLYQRELDKIQPNIAPTISGYQKENPVDQTYLENQARSQAAATMRAVANASNGNRGYISVNNAVNAYNLQNNLGALGINAAKQNQADRLAVAQFNANIDQIQANATMSVEEKNQAIQAERAKLYGNLAQIRTQERYANDTARSQNETNFFTNIGNLGKEVMNLRLANSNLGLYYGINFYTGEIYYKPAYWGLKPEERAQMDQMLGIQANN